MQIRKTFSGILMLILAAVIGMGLIYLPAWIIDKYERISQLGSLWGTLYLIAVSTGTLLVTGSIGWVLWKLYGTTLQKKFARERRNRNPSELSESQKAVEIRENLERIAELKRSGDGLAIQTELDPLVAELEAKREAQTLEIVAFGTISSGKSSVLNLLAGRRVFATDVRGGTTIERNEIPWDGHDRVVLVDTPGVGEIDGEDHVFVAAESARDADLVLLVIDGPLRENEFRLIEKLGQMEKRIIVCLNKVDWYHPDDRERLIRQIQKQTAGIVASDEVVTVQAQPGIRQRNRIAADGTVTHETLEVPTDISALASTMIEVLRNEGKDLLMANVLLQSRGLLEKARERARKALDDRAWEIVNKYMWGAAGVAAVSPFPLIDLAAGVGVSTKMILDLADVYRQKVDLQTASRWLGEMAKILLGVLGSQGASMAVASMATVAATSVAASMVKIVPIAGTLAGNAMQGTIQALLTRWIGAVFIEYFRNEMQAPEGGLAGLARRQWNELMTIDELKRLVQTAREKYQAR